MNGANRYDVIIIGGSFAGLSASMSLGRSLRKVLIIDSGLPCNRQTPQAHNIITHDGTKPSEIADIALQQVLNYSTVIFKKGLAVSAANTGDTFEVVTAEAEIYTAKKLLFTTGVKDEMPAIKGFADCWGISVLHCPYCHGYEVRGEETGIMINGSMASEFIKLIHNWTDKLTVFTNGKNTIEGAELLKHKDITIIEDEIVEVVHQNGYIQQVILASGRQVTLKAMYAKIPMVQHCTIPALLGCKHNDAGFIVVDDFQKTSVHGIYAAGDNTGLFRSVPMAIAAGSKAGAILNKELVDEEF